MPLLLLKMGIAYIKSRIRGIDRLRGNPYFECRGGGWWPRRISGMTPAIFRVVVQNFYNLFITRQNNISNPDKKCEACHHTFFPPTNFVNTTITLFVMV